MTTELQRAMAQYEEARIQYKKAVLASLDGAQNGDAIRRAIQRFQGAGAELRRIRDAQAPSPAEPRAEAAQSAGWGLVRRLLKAAG